MKKAAGINSSGAPSHFAKERQQQIAEALKQQGRVVVATLAVEYGVSEDSIRRDLRILAARGLIQRAHGGAVALNPTMMSAANRDGVFVGTKQAIAAAALRHIRPDQTLFLDSGTTVLALARLIRAGAAPRPLTVVTASFDTAGALIDDPQIRLVLAGGALLRESRSFEGDTALATVASYRADLAFLSACALSPRAGLTAVQSGDAQLKRAMVEGSVRRIVITDQSKLDAVAPHAVCGLDEIDLVICDAAPSWKSAARLEFETV